MLKIKLFGAVAVLATGLGAATSAQAYDGCGWGYHMNAWGHCRPNYRPVGYYGPRPVYSYGPRYVYDDRPAIRVKVPGLGIAFRPY